MTKTRLAVWSGPRNISTSLMRSFSNRGDCKVMDEPFYGAYLFKTRKCHPLRDEIIKNMSTNYNEIAKRCSESNFSEKILYQKQMAHHLCSELDLKFLDRVHNIFLIREPEYVVRSFNEKVENFGLEDIGIKQQLRIFEYLLEKTGRAPFVFSSSDLLAKPEETLRKICKHAGIKFSKKMLSWPKGPHPDDGIWGKIWYHNTNKSTSFISGNSRKVNLTVYQKSIVDQAYPYYQKLDTFRRKFLKLDI